MLTWLGCLLAPRIDDLTRTPLPELPDPRPEDDLEERARAVLEAFARVPFEPRRALGCGHLLAAMGCRDLVTGEADQHPDTAGRTPNYEPFEAFQPVQVPGADGVMLSGHHSVGPPGAPVVIVVHGMFDSHVSRYVVEYAQILARWGFHVFALDLRGHGQLLADGPPPSMGLSEGRDLLAAARTLHAAEGVSVGILGLSYGGHCAVRAAHEATLADETHVLRGGVLSVSAPLNVHSALAAFDDSTQRPRAKGPLEGAILRGVMSTIRRHLRLRAAHYGPHQNPCTDFEGFVREVILPAYPDGPGLVGAFLGAARCTQPSVLGGIAVPTALLHSADDALVSVHNLHEAQAAAGDNPFVRCRELPQGGHVGMPFLDPAGTLSMLAAFFGGLRDG